MRKKIRYTAPALAALMLAVVAACSEDEAIQVPLPEGPPDLHILSLDVPGTRTGVDDAGVAGCFAIGDGSKGECSSAVSGEACGFVVMLRTNENGQIPLLLPDGSQPRFWSFQPPLGCQGAPDCGYALLMIDPANPPCDPHPAAAVTKVAAGPVISLDFDELRTKLGGSFGEKKVRVEFWPGEGVPDKDHCHSTEARVTFELVCAGVTPDGGDGGGSKDAGPDGSDAEAGSVDASADASDASSDATRPPDAAPDATSTPDSSSPDASEGGSPNDVTDARPGDGTVESG